MSDTPRKKKDSQSQSKKFKNVLVWKKDTPYFELTGEEVVYPLVIEDRGTDYRVYFHLTNHTPFEAKAVRTDSIVPIKFEGSEIETGRDNRLPFIKFVDKHFIKLIGVDEKDAELHKQWLDDRPYLKARLYRESVQSIAPIYRIEDDNGNLFSLSSAKEVVHSFTQTLYCPNREAEADLKLEHVLRGETQIDATKYDRAIGGKYHTRRREFTNLTNFDSLNELYDSMAIQTIGYLVGGKPCVKDNKEITQKYACQKIMGTHLLFAQV